MFRKKLEDFDKIINKIEILSLPESGGISMNTILFKEIVKELDISYSELEEQFIRYENRIEELEESLDYYQNPDNYNEF